MQLQIFHYNLIKKTKIKKENLELRIAKYFIIYIIY